MCGGGAIAVLRSAGHDVEWVGDWSTAPGDDQILGRPPRTDKC